MIFGASTSCLYPLETEESLETLGKIGVKNIEIFFNALSELSGSVFEKILETKNSYDLNIVSVHPFLCPIEPMGIFSDYKRRTDEFFDIYKRHFEAMSRLDARLFVLHGAAYERSCTFEVYIERYLMLSELARQYGVTIAQENVINCKSRSLEFLKAVKKELGEKAAFVLDIKQAYRCGEEPFKIFEALGENIVHFHINDRNETSDCIPAGKGTFDFKRLLHCLKAENYAGALILELYRSNFKDISDLKESIGYLEMCAEENIS